MRKLGKVRITYEMLAEFLGLEFGSVLFIDPDNDSGILKIYHIDDNVGTYLLAEGCLVPDSSIDKLSISSRIKGGKNG